MIDENQVNSEFEGRPDTDKDDQAATSQVKQESKAKLIDDEVKHLRRRESVLLCTTFLSGLMTLALFSAVLCTILKFYKVYELHAHVGNISESPLPLSPFILLLSPTVLLSTLFVVTLITTLRFITAYANSKGSHDSADSAVSDLINLLIGLIEKLTKG